MRKPTTTIQAAALGAGESEAIALAREVHAELLLVDDLEARTQASRLGLKVIGTVGVLEMADVKNLASLPSAIERLRSTDFLIAATILEDALARHVRRKHPEHGSK